MCSQHFQGLRRAQNKAEANGFFNPGTPETPRRADPTMNPITRRPGPGRGRPRKSQGGADESMPGAGGGSEGSPVEPQDPALAQTDPALSNDAEGIEQTSVSPLPPNTGADTDPTVAALQQVADDNAEEHPAKRQRMEGDTLPQDEPLDDEAVLALAAHNGTGSTDYDAE